MALCKTIYEGDSLIHSPPRSGSAGGESGPADAKPAPTVAKRRAEAMRSFFPKLSVWLSNRIHFSRMREIERYLSQATDLVDLEHRIARIERGSRWH